jgi:hypothetical protein
MEWIFLIVVCTVPSVVLIGLGGYGLVSALREGTFRIRMYRARKNTFWIMVLMFLTIGIGELVWSPIELLSLVIFVVGGCYSFYDAWLRG